MAQSGFQKHLLAAVGAGPLADATHGAGGEDATCGDRLHVQLAVRDGRIAHVGWSARGCSATLAAASALATLARGRLAIPAALDREALAAELSGLPPGGRHAIGLALRAYAAALATPIVP